MNISCNCKISLRGAAFFKSLFFGTKLNRFFGFFCRLVDNLPVATRVFNPDTKEFQLERGYRLGQIARGNSYLNNHLKFILSYHKHEA